MGDNGAVNSTTSLPDVTFSDDTIGAVGTLWNAENQPRHGAGEGEIWASSTCSGGDLSVTHHGAVRYLTGAGRAGVVPDRLGNQGTTTIHAMSR